MQWVDHNRNAKIIQAFLLLQTFLLLQAFLLLYTLNISPNSDFLNVVFI